MQVIRLRYALLVVLVSVLVALMPLSAATSVYCTRETTGHLKNGCVYDLPGGEALVGPGREVVATSEKAFVDGHLSILRKISVIRTSAISYSVPNVAERYTETEVSYTITNADEPVGDLEIAQPLAAEQAYSVYAGSLGAKASKTVGFMLLGAQGEMNEFAVDYTLPELTLKTAEATVDKWTNVWLRKGAATPVVGESIEITSPSGLKFALMTDEGGMASFVPREVGTYAFAVPHRALDGNTYVQALQELETPSNETALEENKQEGLPATAALVVGALRAQAGSVVRSLGPIGIALVVLLIAFAGWTYLQIRRPEEEVVVAGQDVPPELAPYKEGEQTFVTQKGSITTDIDHLIKIVHDRKRVEVHEAAKLLGVAPQEVEKWAHMLEEEKAIGIEYNLTNMFLVWKGKSHKINGMLNDEEKRRLMDSAVVLSPKQQHELGIAPAKEPKKKSGRKRRK